MMKKKKNASSCVCVCVREPSNLFKFVRSYHHRRRRRKEDCFGNCKGSLLAKDPY